MEPATRTSTPTVELADGRAMPQLGLGVLRVPSDEAAVSVQQALALGYRSVDTAATYGNEEGVGRGIRESGVPRADVFLTTKVWNTDHGYDATLRAFDRSAARLQVDHVDLYLIHWPMPALGLFSQSWAALLELKRQGRARSIGVSNFLPAHLEVLPREHEEQPVVNQVELHPWFQQRELVAYHDAHDIRTEAWSPLGQGQVLQDPVLLAIAEAAGCSPAQVALRWQLDLGHVVIPKSANPDRLRQNLAAFDVRLDQAQRDQIVTLDRGHRIGSHPDKPPTNKLPYDD